MASARTKKKRRASPAKKKSAQGRRRSGGGARTYQVKMASSRAPRAGATGLDNLRSGQMTALPRVIHQTFFGPEYKRYGVHDDGSCFFHTVCCALNLSNCQTKTPAARQRIGHQFRRMVQRKLSNQSWDNIWEKRKLRDKSLLPKVSKVRGMLGNTKTWADVYMIFLTMDLYDLNLVFFDATSDQIYCGVRGLQPENQRTLLILWVNHAHFEPIVRVNPSNSKDTTFLYDKSDAFINHLMKQYHTKHCPGSHDNIHNVL